MNIYKNIKGIVHVFDGEEYKLSRYVDETILIFNGLATSMNGISWLRTNLSKS